MGKPILVEQKVEWRETGAYQSLTPEPAKWSVSRRSGSASAGFSLQLLGLPPDGIKQIKISAGLGGSDLLPLIWDAPVRQRDGEWRQGAYYTSLSGIDQSEQLIQLAPDRDLIFLSRDYVDKVAKGWQWRLNKETYQVEGYLRYQGREYSWPLKVPEIPRHPDAKGSFETIIITEDRGQILQIVADRLGIELFNNTPAAPFRHSYTLRTSQTYFSAFRNLTAVWNPLIYMEYNIQSGKWRLVILDVESSAFTAAATGSMEFEQKDLRVLSMRRERQQIVNRARIIGGERDQTFTYTSTEAPPITRDPKEILPDYEVERWVEAGKNSEPLPYCPSYSELGKVRIVKAYAIDPADFQNRLLCREELYVYGDYENGSQLVSKKVTTYLYLDYTAAVGQNVEIWHRIQLPGQSSPCFRKIKEIKTNYGDYIELAGEIEREEIEKGLCIYDCYENTRVNPQEITVAEQDKTIRVDSQTAQSYLWTQIRRKLVRYDVEDANRVRRDTCTWNNLDGTVEMDVEYIPVSYDQRPRRTRPHERSFWEFEDQDSIEANGCRPLVEITVEDLKEGEDDGLAQEIWERIKRKSGEELCEARVALPVWAPASLGELVKIRQASMKQWDPATKAFAGQTIPEGAYFITGIDHQYEMNPQTREARLTTTLALRKTWGGAAGRGRI